MLTSALVCLYNLGGILITVSRENYVYNCEPFFIFSKPFARVVCASPQSQLLRLLLVRTPASLDVEGVPAMIEGGSVETCKACRSSTCSQINYRLVTIRLVVPCVSARETNDNLISEYGASDN